MNIFVAMIIAYLPFFVWVIQEARGKHPKEETYEKVETDENFL